MLKKIAAATIFLSFIILSGCTTAGPFVTNVSSDGNGGLVIEKTYVKMNAFTGTISNEGGTTTTIKLLGKQDNSVEQR
jgi:type IV secretion system protein VirB7